MEYILRVVMVSFGLLLASVHAEPLKILIFTAPYGAGHDKAAEKIRNLILEKDPKAVVIIKNAQDFMPEAFRRVSMKFFNWAQTEAPWLYTMAFDDYLKKGSRVRSASQMPMTWGINIEAMAKWIEQQSPQVLLSTWPHATEVLIRLRQFGFFKEIPVGTVVTDFVSASNREKKSHRSRSGKDYFTLLASEVDRAFLPGASMLEDYIKAGVDFKKLSVSGMPLSLIDRPPLTVASRHLRMKEARRKLSLPENQKTILIEGGANGVGNYPLMIGSLLSAFPNQKITILAACGKSKSQYEDVMALINGVGADLKRERVLYNKMKPLIRKLNMSRENLIDWIRNGIPEDQAFVQAIGFEPLSDYRYAADVVATKPGGLSTSEMGSDGIPMILRSGLASGQELFNVRFFVNAKLAIVEEDEAKIGLASMRLIQDRKFISDLISNSEVFRKANRTDLIADWAIESARALPADLHPKVGEKFESRCRRFVQKIFRQLSRDQPAQ